MMLWHREMFSENWPVETHYGPVLPAAHRASGQALLLRLQQKTEELHDRHSQHLNEETSRPQLASINATISKYILNHIL